MTRLHPFTWVWPNIIKRVGGAVSHTYLYCRGFFSSFCVVYFMKIHNVVYTWKVISLLTYSHNEYLHYFRKSRDTWKTTENFTPFHINMSCGGLKWVQCFSEMVCKCWWFFSVSLALLLLFVWLKYCLSLNFAWISIFVSPNYWKCYTYQFSILKSSFFIPKLL